MRDPSLPDHRNIGIGPAGRDFMGALLRLGDALGNKPLDSEDANATCPVCSLLLDGDYCHQCERETSK